MYWYFEVLKKYLVLKGRASRSEYWYSALFYAISLVLATIIDMLTGHFNAAMGFGWLSGVYFVLTLAPMMGVSVRRLHDVGRSGWWVWLGFVPLIGDAVLAVFALFDSQPGDNEYGPNPKQLNQSLTRPGNIEARTGVAPRRRPRTLLTVLGVVICSVLVLAGSGRSWWFKHGDQLIAASRAMVEEGARNGSGMEESACVSEAVERGKTVDASLLSSVKDGLWLKGCLHTSRAQEAFCADIPAKNEILALAAWVNGECARHSMEANPYCSTIFQGVSGYCLSGEHEAKLSVVASSRVDGDTAPAPHAEHPAKAASLDRPTVDALMHKSGLWTVLASVSAQTLSSTTDTAGGAVNSSALTEARAAALFAFSPERLRASVGRGLSTGMSAAEAAETLDWLDSDVGRRIMSLEAAAARSQANPDQVIRVGMHLLPSLSRVRVDLLRQLVHVSRQGEGSAAMVTNIGLALAASSAGKLAGASAPDYEAFRRQAEEGRPALAKRFEQTGPASFAQAYARVSDDDLARYLVFLGSVSGQRYVAASLEAMDSSLAEAADIMRRGIRGAPPKAST